MQRTMALLSILATALCVVAAMSDSVLPILLSSGAAVLGVWPAFTGKRGRNSPAQGWRLADCVTCLRLGLLLVVLTTVLEHPGVGFGWLTVALAIPMLTLDLVDGLVARATATTSVGARFDERVDATVILVFSVGLVPIYGIWCLISGMAHFAFRLIAGARPSWRAPLPPSRRRKIIAALQGPLLLAAGSPPGLDASFFGWACTLAAVSSLLVSFAIDIIDVECRHADVDADRR